MESPIIEAWTGMEISFPPCLGPLPNVLSSMRGWVFNRFSIDWSGCRTFDTEITNAGARCTNMCKGGERHQLSEHGDWIADLLHDVYQRGTCRLTHALREIGPVPRISNG